jgi:hypothetical protein
VIVAALQLLGDGVDVAKAALEGIRGEDGDAAGGVVGESATSRARWIA